MGQVFFTCTLPGGAIIPSSPRQLRHCVCNLEMSYICIIGECSVEFVLTPQHETSYDPETTTKEDFDYLR